MYTLKCLRCGKSITAPVSFGETLFHACTAILSHWNIIHPHEDTNESEMTSMLLLFTSYESYLQSLMPFQEAVNSPSGDNQELVQKN